MTRGRFGSEISDTLRAEKVDVLLGEPGKTRDRAVRLFETSEPGIVLDGMIDALMDNGFWKSSADFAGMGGVVLPKSGALLANSRQGALTTQVGVANIERVSAFIPPWDLTIDQVGISCSTALAASTSTVTIYASDKSGRPTQKIVESAQIDTSTTGTKMVVASCRLTKGEIFWIGARFSGTQTLRSIANTSCAALAWSNAATPLPYLCLTRTAPYPAAAPNWTFDNTHLGTATPPLVLLRAA